jgi:hypothetical protein
MSNHDYSIVKGTRRREDFEVSLLQIFTDMDK